MEFGRVLLIATRRRWSIVGILLTSTFVAILWGANIGTLYPLVEVVFKGDSLPAYVDKKIESTDAEIAKYAQDIHRLNLEAAAALPDNAHRLRLNVQSTEAAQNAAVKSADTLRWVQHIFTAFARTVFTKRYCSLLRY